MSMPDITLEVIDPRTALASIVASIALQEAAVSHVLNAEGEKIQAVVGMTGATVADLQDINRSVGETVDNVALLEDDLQSKLRTALQGLYPTATLLIHFIDSLTYEPVNCQCLLCTLTDDATGDSATIYARRDILALPNLKPGSYTLHMIDACAGYAHNENVYDIYVDAKGDVMFNGAAVSDESPAVIEMDESASMAAAQAAVPAPVAAPAPVRKPCAQKPCAKLVPEPAPEPEAAPVTLPQPDTNSQYVVYTLTNDTTGGTSTFYAEDYSKFLANLKPGNYTLHMVDVFARKENVFGIDVDAGGRVMFRAPQL